MTSPRTAFILESCAIVTGDAAGTVLENHSIGVDKHGTIVYVGPADAAPHLPGARRINLHGKFVLPGLINAHAHLFSDGKPLHPALTSERGGAIAAKVFNTLPGRALMRKRTKANILTQLNSGVTGLRSLGDPGYEVVEAREAIEAGEYVGPRILASGPLLAATGGHGVPQIALVNDSPWEGRRNVRHNLRNGATCIKIAATGGVTDARSLGEAGRPQLTEEEMAAICDEAHEAGVIVAAHAQGEVGVTAALKAGVDTIEHGCPLTPEMVELFKNNPRSLRGYSALVPTLIPALPLARLDTEVTKVNDVVKQNGIAIFEGMLDGLRTALAEGVVIGTGTDSACTYVTHYSLWRELDYLVRFGGMTPAQALHAATQTNAEILGWGDVTGRVQEGFDADLVVVDANPLESFRNLSAPHMVIARGHLIEEPAFETLDELDAVLDGI